jgi:hypothetical protein
LYLLTWLLFVTCILIIVTWVGLGSVGSMVGDTGFEPVASAMSTQCSNQLS